MGGSGVLAAGAVAVSVLVLAGSPGARPVAAAWQGGPTRGLTSAPPAQSRNDQHTARVVSIAVDPGHSDKRVPGAGAALVIGSYQQVLINSDRARAGLGPLSWSGCLQSVAAANARRMAAQGYISHTNGPWLDLDCGLGAQGGENVGWWSGGVNDVQLNSMFMASSDHRANIMGPYHYVATAWAVGANGWAYIAVEFT